MIQISAFSKEIIEATFRYSHNTGQNLILSITPEQSNYEDGYLGRMSTLFDFLRTLNHKYPANSVIIARGSLGPNKHFSIADVFSTMEKDMRNDLKLIHLDFQELRKSYAIDKLTEAIKYCKRLNPSVQFHLGSKHLRMSDFQKHVESVISVVEPQYYTVYSGTDLVEDKQFGRYALNIYNRHKLQDYNVELIDLECDFLTDLEIKERKYVSKILSIGYEMAVNQSEMVVNKEEAAKFIEIASKDKRVKKHLDLTLPDDLVTCTCLGGYYHFESPDFKRIMDRELTIESHMRVIERYVRNFIF